VWFAAGSEAASWCLNELFKAERDRLARAS
jgi:hypothetical protein